MGHTSLITHLSLIISGPGRKAQEIGRKAHGPCTRTQGSRKKNNYLVDYVPIISYIINCVEGKKLP